MFLVETVKMAVLVIKQLDDVTMAVIDIGLGTHANVCNILSYESCMNSIEWHDQLALTDCLSVNKCH